MSNKKEEAIIHIEMKGREIEINLSGSRMNIGILLATAVDNIEGFGEIVVAIANSLQEYREKQKSVEPKNDKEA